MESAVGVTYRFIEGSKYELKTRDNRLLFSEDGSVRIGNVSALRGNKETMKVEGITKKQERRK